MKNLNLQTLFRIGGFVPIIILLFISMSIFYINLARYQNADLLTKKLELFKITPSATILSPSCKKSKSFFTTSSGLIFFIFLVIISVRYVLSRDTQAEQT